MICMHCEITFTNHYGMVIGPYPLFRLINNAAGTFISQTYTHSLLIYIYPQSSVCENESLALERVIDVAVPAPLGFPSTHLFK